MERNVTDPSMVPRTRFCFSLAQTMQVHGSNCVCVRVRFDDSCNTKDHELSDRKHKTRK